MVINFFWDSLDLNTTFQLCQKAKTFNQTQTVSHAEKTEGAAVFTFYIRYVQVHNASANDPSIRKDKRITTKSLRQNTKM